MPRFGHSPHSSMQHLNGNLLCAIDVETTGLIPGKHDIIQLAILPLDSQIKPSSTAPPFCINMKPKRPENIDQGALKVNRVEFASLLINGFDPWKALDMLDEYFERLRLPVNKKIVPLGHNFIFDSAFLKEWMGELTYEHIFDFRYRDTMVAASFVNDRCDFRNEKFAYPKLSLSYLCSQLRVENVKAHDALSDTVATAECYRRLLGSFIP